MTPQSKVLLAPQRRALKVEYLREYESVNKTVSACLSKCRDRVPYSYNIGHKSEIQFTKEHHSGCFTIATVVLFLRLAAGMAGWFGWLT